MAEWEKISPLQTDFYPGAAMSFEDGLEYNQYYVISATTITYIVLSVDRFFQLIEKLENP